MARAKSKKSIWKTKYIVISNYISQNPVIKNTFYILLIFAMLSWLKIIRIGPLVIPDQKYITVTGTYIDVQTNQVALFTATVMEFNKDKNVVIENINKKSVNLIESVKNFGIDPINIKTTGNTLYQSEEQIPSPYNKNQTITENMWRGSVSIEIKLDDIEKAGELFSLLTSQEAVEVYGPSYSINEKNIDEGRLLVNALDDAKEKALFIVKNNKQKLGKIISIEELAGQYNPYYPQVLGTDSLSEQFIPGSTQVSKSVKVTFELR